MRVQHYPVRAGAYQLPPRAEKPRGAAFAAHAGNNATAAVAGTTLGS